MYVNVNACSNMLMYVDVCQRMSMYVHVRAMFGECMYIPEPADSVSSVSRPPAPGAPLSAPAVFALSASGPQHSPFCLLRSVCGPERTGKRREKKN